MAKREDILGLRVDQVGSLLRPKSLVESFLDHGRGRIGAAELDRRVETAVQEVVAKQEALGFPVVTDGEYTRLNWQVSFAQVEGWSLSEVSWKSFLASPSMRMTHEHANERGADAVEVYKTPATGRPRTQEQLSAGRIPQTCKLRAYTRQGHAHGAGPGLADV